MKQDVRSPRYSLRLPPGVIGQRSKQVAMFATPVALRVCSDSSTYSSLSQTTCRRCHGDPPRHPDSHAAGSLTTESRTTNQRAWLFTIATATGGGGTFSMCS
ncbi:unnamed protein product [Gadus morhua 'NCC']